MTKNVIRMQGRVDFTKEKEILAPVVEKLKALGVTCFFCMEKDDYRLAYAGGLSYDGYKDIMIGIERKYPGISLDAVKKLMASELSKEI